MQQGHPRYKQLSRARDEMRMHNRRKSLDSVIAIRNLFATFGESAITVSKKIKSAFSVINKQMFTPIVNYDKVSVPDISTDITTGLIVHKEATQ
ncbi:hypothetical protein [Leuconostoc gasicomitatum]|uniref:hypothetical protein n=1 Tax=Leuconostoc gasicomitatum TaxID=115778 RepID=UPI0015CE0458|nr:hypothetical protein [Leuconostoc gasicomitatum]QLG77584.1 hypothetical protein LeuG3613_01405 [Leuconostoc gasicomitatum]